MTRLALAALLASGCAYIPRVVRLEQPLPLPPHGAPVCVTVEPFTDARADRTRIGVARNGLYWPTASARTDDDVALWVTVYLRGALASATPCAGELALKGQVRHLFVDEFFTLDGRLVVSVRLERQGAVLLEADFEGTHGQLSQLGSNAEFEETLRGVLASFGEAALPAILAAAASAPPPPGL